MTRKHCHLFMLLTNKCIIIIIIIIIYILYILVYRNPETFAEGCKDGKNLAINGFKKSFHFKWISP